MRWVTAAASALTSGGSSGGSGSGSGGSGGSGSSDGRSIVRVEWVCLHAGAVLARAGAAVAVGWVRSGGSDKQSFA